MANLALVKKMEEKKAAPNLFDKAVIIGVQLGGFGNRRKAGKSEIQTEADKTLLHLQKQLIDCYQLEAITSKNGEITRYIDTVCLPCPMMKKGARVVSLEAVDQVYEKLQELKREREGLVEALQAVWDREVAKSERRLGPYFRSTDYCSAADLKDRFSMEVDILTLGVPGTLAKVNKALFDSEKEKFSRKASEAFDEIREYLRKGLRELVDHAVERLTGTDKDGKPKKFNETMITKLSQFIDTFNIRNITDDSELAVEVAKLKDVVQGINPKRLSSLKKSDRWREDNREKFQAIKDSMDKSLIVKPTRAMDFDEV